MGGHRTSSTASVVGITLAVVVLLAGAIVLAWLFAPEKPVAPPPSVLSFESRPKPSDRVPPAPEPEPAASDNLPDAPVESTAAPEPASEPASEFFIVGSVRSVKSGDSVAGARIAVQRQVSPEQHDAWLTKERALVAAKDADGLTAFNAERRAALAQAGGRSDAEGRFRISVAAPGRFEVKVSHPEYLSPAVAEAEIPEEGEGPPLVIVLSSGATISGRVTEAGSSLGVEGLPVQAAVYDDTGARSRTVGAYTLPAPQVTGADGKYTLAGLPPGDYGVSVDLDRTAYKAGREMPFTKVSVTNPDQSVTGVNFQVDPAGVVWGYVTTPDREPVRAEVILATSESIFSQALSAAIKRAPPLRDRAEEDGYYELLGVPLNREWQVYATADDLAPQLAEPFLLTPTHRTARIDIFMFTGTVVYGQVIDTRGKPVPEAEVLCIPGFTKLFRPMRSAEAFRTTRADAEGYFTILELPGGEYQVFGRKKGFKLSTVGEPIYPDGFTNIENLRVVLEAVDEGEHYVAGRVTDENGSPLSDVQISLTGLGTESLNGIERETSTSGGNYRIDGLEAGVYQIMASKEGYAPAGLGRVLLDAENDIVMRAVAMVSGRVLVRESGQAPEVPYTVTATPFLQGGATSFNMRSMEPTRAEFQNADGSFTLNLAPGAYELEARAEDLTPGRTRLTLASGQIEEDVTIYLSEAGGRIEGVVVTSSGDNPQGATVLLVDAGTPIAGLISQMDPGATGTRSQRVGADGLFAFNHLPAGEYVALAQHEQFAEGRSGTIPLAPNGSATGIRIVLGTGGALEGYVSRGGKPSPNVIVVVFAGGSPQTATTDRDGYYYLDGLPTGTHQAMVAQAGLGDMSGQTVPVEIVEGETTRHDFGDGSGTRVEGRCMPPPPALVPFPGAPGGFALLRHPSQPIMPTLNPMGLSGITSFISSTDGSYAIDDVPPGEWHLDIYYSPLNPNAITDLAYVQTEMIAVQGEELLVRDIAIAY